MGEYMDMLKEEDPERYKVAFSKFIEEDKEDGLDDMYKECHKAIRENPTYEHAEKKNIVNTRQGDTIVVTNGDHKTTYTRKQKKSHKQRKARVAQKLSAARAKLLADAEEEEEEE